MYKDLVGTIIMTRMMRAMKLATNTKTMTEILKAKMTCQISKQTRILIWSGGILRQSRLTKPK